MWKSEDLSARLPAPLDGEPRELRRDIADELADHLVCAMAREQRAGNDEPEAARRRVLARFGDPVAVARKLWRDALWEKIMSQRILVGVCLAMTAASVAALALMWRSLDRQQTLLDAWQASNQQQAQRQSELFERLFAQTEKTSQSIRQTQELFTKSIPPAEWNPVEIRFRSGTLDGPPVAGARVELNPQGNASVPSQSGVSNTDGIVRFERVRYGSYGCRLILATKESTFDSFSLQPGESVTRTIVGPATSPTSTEVVVRIAWPEELAARELWFRFLGQNVGRRVNVSERYFYWHPPSGVVPGRDGLADGVVIEPNGTMHHDNFIHFDPRRSMTKKPISFRSWSDADRNLKSLTWPGDGYVIPQIDVLQPAGRLLPTGGSFWVVNLPAGDWGYRVEAGIPGTLWLTPTAAAIEQVKKELPPPPSDELSQTAEKRDASDSPD
jgi:hypothetical protein